MGTRPTSSDSATFTLRAITIQYWNSLNVSTRATNYWWHVSASIATVTIT